MQTAQSQNQPSLSELFNQLNELNKANMTSKVSEMSFGGIDPAILQQTVADGGPLSSAANFADSSAWTMTPEMFKQTIASRPDAMAEAGRATSLSDAVFGRTAKQKALLEAQAQDVASRGRTLQTAGQMYEGGQDRTARAAEGAANRANQMEIQKLQEAGANRRQAAQIQSARDLARVAASGGFGDYFTQKAKNGEPLHTEQEQAQIARVIQSDPKKLDPTVLAESKLRAIQLGLLGTGGEPVKVSKGGWFKGTDTYQVRLNKETGRKHVIKVLPDGKLQDMGLVSTMVPSRAIGGSSSGSTSRPAFMTPGYGE